MRTAALGSLLDYDDGDDLIPVDSSDEGPPPSRPDSPASEAGVPASPRFAHRQIVIGKALPDVPEDPEDSLLESLVSMTGPPSPSLTKTPPGELGLKRRREEEDDEMLERLANKAKKQTAGASPGKDKPPAVSQVFVKLGAAKPAEEAKKIKLKLSSPSPTPSPSSPGVKDGDTG